MAVEDEGGGGAKSCITVGVSIICVGNDSEPFSLKLRYQYCKEKSLVVL
jgi:hypothetical protein